MAKPLDLYEGQLIFRDLPKLPYLDNAQLEQNQIQLQAGERCSYQDFLDAINEAIAFFEKAQGRRIIINTTFQQKIDDLWRRLN